LSRIAVEHGIGSIWDPLGRPFAWENKPRPVSCTTQK
jgi:hypothetical protein